MTGRRRAILCLVTDRRRLCATLQRPASAWREPLLEQIQGAIRGGIDLVQIREPDLPAADLAALVRGAVSLAAASAARVVVNERLDVAVVSGAGGVHLRENSLDAAQARRLTPAGFLVGRSIHTVRDAEPAVDYLIAGTVFPTVSKPGPGAVLGLEGLAAVIERAGSTPVLAIGGVTEARVRAVVQAGASGCAAIGAFLPDAGALAIAESVQESVQRLRFEFDSDSAVF